MNKQIFFKEIKQSVFGGMMRQSQVDGIEDILSACDFFAVNDNKQQASILATPMIETGGTFLPIKENLNYSSEALVAKFGKRIGPAQAKQYGRRPGQVANQEMIANIIYGGEWGERQLGNIRPGDGWLYRGRGLVQITGRRNYEKLGKLVGVDLIGNPDLASNQKIAANILVVGMRDGVFTTKKISDYLGPGKSDWKNARRVVNGNDRDVDLQAWSLDFFAALQKAA